jgi:hypothetical protein
MVLDVLLFCLFEELLLLLCIRCWLALQILAPAYSGFWQQD